MEIELEEKYALKSVNLRIAGYVFLSFIGYFCIGLPLAILPIYIHKSLGYSEVVSGVVISLQYLTTFVMRGYAGKVVDTHGPKLAVKISMSGFIISGILLVFSFLYASTPWLSLLILAITRLITGCAEGFIGASPINWAMLNVGSRHTATAISFNGIASYGALAVGAPLGVFLQQMWGLQSISFMIILAGLFGLFYTLPKKAAKTTAVVEEQLSFKKILALVAPFGISLGLAGIGFGGISNFITLYYDYFNWSHAALCLTVFSILFIFGRLFFHQYIDKYGGMKVALICVFTEMVGLIILFLAGTQEVALIGAAITGLGFSLVFPALGVEAVRRAPAAYAGAALAGYGLFIDISLGLTGPMAGGVIKLFGMPYLFAYCSLMLVICLILVALLTRKG